MADKNEGRKGERKDDTGSLIWGIGIIFVLLLIYAAVTQGLPAGWVGSLP
tara:strand:- start:678 stop:827 length:150 start_codon:yes stop_codon:yes gene_type:complete